MRLRSSRQNPIVAAFRTLADQPDPTGTRLLLDGAHLVKDARASGLQFERVAVAASRLTSPTEERQLAERLEREGIDVIEASDAVFDVLSPVKTPSGIVAIAARNTVTATDICAQPDAFILTMINVQEPGNVGALLRAAEAGGISGALVCGASANPFSWKAVRGSMGSVLRLPIVAGITTHQAMTTMRAAGVRLIGAIPRGGDDPDSVNWQGKVALLLGGEGPGLTDEAIAQCDARVTIPMAGGVESLNVAVAGAILVYSARRQRA